MLANIVLLLRPKIYIFYDPMQNDFVLGALTTLNNNYMADLRCPISWQVLLKLFRQPTQIIDWMLNFCLRVKSCGFSFASSVVTYRVPTFGS